jgi:hypothetical protein
MTNNSQKSIAEDAGTKPFYMVIRLGSGGLQQHDSSPTVRYDSIVEAAEEAKRLAAKYPAHPRGFALVRAVAIYKAEVSIHSNYLNGEWDNPALNISTWPTGKARDL